jgi:AcrR family transcriptional regulator
LRSQQRVSAVLGAAEALIAKIGPEKTSIPEIASVSGVPRSSIYQFFPDKYALFAHITQQHLDRVVEVVALTGAERPLAGYQEIISVLVDKVSDYYDASPVASTLVLGGPFSRAAYLAQTTNTGHIGREVRLLAATRPHPLKLPEKPDVATIAVEIAFACMKHGYYRDGHLSSETRCEAVRAVAAYIAAWA